MYLSNRENINKIKLKRVLALGKLFCRSLLCFSSFRRFPPLLLNLEGSFAFFWKEKQIYTTNITTWTDDCIKYSTTKIMRMIRTSSSKYRVQFSRHLATPSKSSLWSSKYFSRVLTSASCWLRSSSVKSSVKSRHALCDNHTYCIFSQRFPPYPISFTCMIRKERFLLLLAIEAFLPKKCNLFSDGLNDTLHAVRFQHFQMLELSLKLKRHNKHH